MVAIIVADTSLFVRLDRTRKLTLVEKYVARTQRVIVVPPRVKRELIEQPRRQGIYLDSVERLERLLGSGAVQVREVDFQQRDVARACDGARRRIAQLSSRPEHLIERADVEIVGLAVQLSREGQQVEVAMRDAALEDALAMQVRARRLSVAIVDVDVFMTRLVQGI